MAGIYVHIPFCRKACHYCDFHFSTSLKLKDELISALLQEIELRHEGWEEKEIHTLYFGGGTPSVVPASDLKRIIDKLLLHFRFAGEMEVTLEANPDDCTVENLQAWKDIGINRLSIGVQSFFDDELVWMNRSHNSNQAIQSIETAAKLGFAHINMDLIYGVPSSQLGYWEKNVAQAMSLPINHLSAYSLTVEENTALDHFIRNKKYPSISDDQAVREFEFLQEAIEQNGWEHYEISNYCKQGQYAVHNTNYWRQQPYMGIGPSAHSFDGRKRSWNIANNPKYIRALVEGDAFREEEILTDIDRFNEAMMLGLRTQWGIDVERINRDFGFDLLKHNAEIIKRHEVNGLIAHQNGTLTLTGTGKRYADQIASDLFIETQLEG